MFWGAPCCLALCMESVQWIGLFWPILWPKTEPAGRRAVSTACTVCHVLQLFLRKALEVAVTWNLFMWLMSRDSFHLNARTQCFPGKSVMCASPVSGFNVGADLSGANDVLTNWQTNTGIHSGVALLMKRAKLFSHEFSPLPFPRPFHYLVLSLGKEDDGRSQKQSCYWKQLAV